MNNLLFFQSTITKVVLKLAMSKSLTLMLNLDLKSQQGSTRDALTSARRLVDSQCTACTRNAPLRQGVRMYKYTPLRSIDYLPP